MFEGKEHSARNAKDVMVQVFELLAKRDTTFLDRFAALPKHGRKRRYLARNSDELYPGRPDLVSEYSLQLSSGYWLGTNYSRKNISDIIEMAGKVTGLQFGGDLQINLGD
ncbi:MAG: hypothetical protein HY804_03145 [Nitrospinae bacterium]|nr:hypothetical protein [Nitrospinota bacterium]